MPNVLSLILAVTDSQAVAKLIQNPNVFLGKRRLLSIAPPRLVPSFPSGQRRAIGAVHRLCGFRKDQLKRRGHLPADVGKRGRERRMTVHNRRLQALKRMIEQAQLLRTGRVLRRLQPADAGGRGDEQRRSNEFNDQCPLPSSLLGCPALAVPFASRRTLSAAIRAWNAST